MILPPFGILRTENDALEGMFRYSRCPKRNATYAALKSCVRVLHRVRPVSTLLPARYAVKFRVRMNLPKTESSRELSIDFIPAFKDRSGDRVALCSRFLLEDQYIND